MIHFTYIEKNETAAGRRLQQPFPGPLSKNLLSGVSNYKLNGSMKPETTKPALQTAATRQ